MPVSPSRTSISSTELADEATAIDSSSPTGSLTRSASSAFKMYQRSSSSQNVIPGEESTSGVGSPRPSSGQRE